MPRPRRDSNQPASGKPGAVHTFVYFLGERDDAWLKDLADSYLAHRGQLREQLERYFGVLSEAYAKQTVLRVNKCPPAGGSNDGF